MERVKSIPKIADRGIDMDAEMGINCEWVCPFLEIMNVVRSEERSERARLTPSSTNIYPVLSMTPSLTTVRTSLESRHSRYVFWH